MAETPQERLARWRSVSLAPSATPSRRGGAEASRIAATERQWTTDGDAYKRLRADGLQPPGIDGSAVLEARANHPVEVAAGRTFHPEAINIVTDNGGM